MLRYFTSDIKQIFEEYAKCLEKEILQGNTRYLTYVVKKLKQRKKFMLEMFYKQA